MYDPVKMNFHSAYSLEKFLPDGGWVNGMRELIREGYAFERISDSYRLRRRDFDENRQSLVELVAHVDLSMDEKMSLHQYKPVKPNIFDDPTDLFGIKIPIKVEEEFDATSDADSFDKDDSLFIAKSNDELVLPANASLTMTSAILAKKGAGKTYLGSVIAEEFLERSDMPFVVIDPTGAWTGLRSTVDGEPSPYSVLILGGSRGDVPMTFEQGAQAAQVVHVLNGFPVILDLSLMKPEEQHQFVAVFGENLYNTVNDMPFHLFIDEADEFAPQYPDKDSKFSKKSLRVIDRIVRRGRIKGIGVTLITQRMTVINKNVVSQVDNLFVLSMVNKLDIASVSDMIRASIPHQEKMACLDELSELPQGVSYFIQYGAKSKVRRFTVRIRKTFDSSQALQKNKVGSDLSVIDPSVIELASSILEPIDESDEKEDE